jgi:uncharacterized protein
VQRAHAEPESLRHLLGAGVGAQPLHQQYFEEHTRKLRQNVQADPRVCLLLVNSKRWLWLRALYRGRFESPPGMRLTGVASARRPATQVELTAYQARVKPFRRLRGYDLIWKDLSHVRDITLTGLAPILYPTMTDGLWA